jgi:hypothetical protein
MHDISAADLYGPQHPLTRSVAQWLEHRSPKTGEGVLAGTAASLPARIFRHFRDSKYGLYRPVFLSLGPHLGPFASASRSAMRLHPCGSRHQKFILLDILFVGVPALGDKATWPPERRSREGSRRPRLSEAPFSFSCAGKRKGQASGTQPSPHNRPLGQRVNPQSDAVLKIRFAGLLSCSVENGCRKVRYRTDQIASEERYSM